MSKGETTPGAYVSVREYDDLANTTNRMSDPDRNIVTKLVNDGLPEGHGVAMWIPDFIEKPEIEALNSESRIHTGFVEDYSDDAWAFRQGEEQEPVFCRKGGLSCSNQRLIRCGLTKQGYPSGHDE